MENAIALRCDASSRGKWFPVFWRNGCLHLYCFKYHLPSYRV